MDSNTSIRAMALTRFICSFLEMLGVVFLLRSETVRAALKVNALLSMIGPALLVVSWVIGVSGMTVESTVSLKGLLAVVAGVILIFLGTGT